MKQEAVLWKAKGKYFRFKEWDTFYFQEGRGENLLIIHGYPYNSYEWKPITDELSKSYRITVLDLLGMGFSDKPTNYNYTFPNQCNIIDALLKELQINETHIFCHDLGVSIVQELIARDSQNNNSFKILSSAFMNGGLFVDVYKPRLIQRLLSQTPKPIGKLFTKLLSKKAIEKSVSEVFGEKTKPSQGFLDIQWDILNFKDGLNVTHLLGKMVFDKKFFQERWITSLQETKIPLCYICGPYDPNSGFHMATRYNELIPNPIVYMLDDKIGHWPQVEDPKLVLQTYEKFRLRIKDKK